jgi:hypothetical protein
LQVLDETLHETMVVDHVATAQVPRYLPKGRQQFTGKPVCYPLTNTGPVDHVVARLSYMC